MDSKTYSPTKLTTYKVFANLTNGQKIEIQINKNFPSFWKALFIESILVDRSIAVVERKLKSFGQFYALNNKIEIRKIYLSKFEMGWADFYLSSENKNLFKNTSLLKETVYAEYSYE